VERSFGVTVAAALGVIVTLLPVAETRAASSITSAQWSAFVDGNDIDRCFPGFVVSFESVDSIAAPPPVTLPHADFEKFSAGDDLGKPMATQIIVPNAGTKASALTAERDGDFVAFVVAVPGEIARGFVAAGTAMPPIDPGPAGTADALLAKLTPALALIPKDSGLTKCGLTRVTFVDARNPDNGTSIQLILRDGAIVGGAETRL
jgi:hypothetical protein